MLRLSAFLEPEEKRYGSRLLLSVSVIFAAENRSLIIALILSKSSYSF